MESSRRSTLTNEKCRLSIIRTVLNIKPLFKLNYGIPISYANICLLHLFNWILRMSVHTYPYLSTQNQIIFPIRLALQAFGFCSLNCEVLAHSKHRTNDLCSVCGLTSVSNKQRKSSGNILNSRKKRNINITLARRRHSDGRGRTKSITSIQKILGVCTLRTTEQSWLTFGMNHILMIPTTLGERSMFEVSNLCRFVSWNVSLHFILV